MPVTQHAARHVDTKHCYNTMLLVLINIFLLASVNMSYVVQALASPSPLARPTRICIATPGSTAEGMMTLSTIAATPIEQVHRQYRNLPEGKHWNERVAIDAVVVKKQQIKQISPRLVFLRVQDSRRNSNIRDDDDDDDDESDKRSRNDDGFIELLLRERDGFLSSQDIETIKSLAAQPGAILHCRAFPEKLSSFDGPSFFLPQEPVQSSSVSSSLSPLANNTNANTAVASSSSSSTTICLHVVAVNVTTSGGEFLPVCPIEKQRTTIKLLPGRMPPLDHQRQQQQRGQRSNNSRGGRRNRGRGAIFAAWALETFAFVLNHSSCIVDVAGGAGQLAFEFGVRRGINTTVIDPRPLRLSSGQQRTLAYHRETGLRLLPPGRNVSLPAFDYGHHFCEVVANSKNDDTQRTAAPNNNTIPNWSDQTWLVGGAGARVRHLAKWFDMGFGESDIWRDASLVLGMHPDEATEDLVDLALAHDKRFAVVPCCVFWKLDPDRKSPSTGKAVRNREQFCEYLAAKDEQRIEVTTLPIPGRNVVLYSLGREGRSN
jgi:hypothetical protein